eukprot:gene877-957_t
MTEVERDKQDEGLPLPWYRYFTDDGEEYFYNDETGETSWHHPVGERESLESHHEEVVIQPSAPPEIHSLPPSTIPASEQEELDERQVEHQQEEGGGEEEDAGNSNETEGEGEGEAVVPAAAARSASPALPVAVEVPMTTTTAGASPPATVHATPWEHGQEEDNQQGVIHVTATTTASSNPFDNNVAPSSAGAGGGQSAAASPPPTTTSTSNRTATSPAPRVGNGNGNGHAGPARPSRSSPAVAPRSAPVLNSSNPFEAAHDNGREEAKHMMETSSTVRQRDNVQPGRRSFNPFAESKQEMAQKPSSSNSLPASTTTTTASSSNASCSSILQELHARRRSPAAPLTANSTQTTATLGPSPTQPQVMHTNSQGYPDGGPTRRKSSMLLELQRGGGNNNNKNGNRPVAPPVPPPSKGSSSGMLQAAQPPSRQRSWAGSHHSKPAIDISLALRNLSPQLLQLMKWGVCQIAAESALERGKDDLTTAMSFIHKEVVTLLHNDPTASLHALWKPRLMVRIGSWLPKLPDEQGLDYHTGYVTSIGYSNLFGDKVESWQVNLRFHSFKAVYQVVQRFEYLTTIISPFPSSGISLWMAGGVDDNVRNERMFLLDKWIREIVVDPILMTIKEVVEIVYSTLEVNAHVREGN